MKRFFKKIFCKHVYKNINHDPTFLYCVKCTKEKHVKDHNQVNTKPNHLPFNTLVKVYLNTPTFEEGEVGVILDYDSINKDYAIAPLRSFDKHKGDMFTMLEKEGKWVNKKNFEVMDFKRQKSKYLDYLIPFFMLVVGLYIGQFFGF